MWGGGGGLCTFFGGLSLLCMSSKLGTHRPAMHLWEGGGCAPFSADSRKKGTTMPFFAFFFFGTHRPAMHLWGGGAVHLFRRTLSALSPNIVFCCRNSADHVFAAPASLLVFRRFAGFTTVFTAVFTTVFTTVFAAVFAAVFAVLRGSLAVRRAGRCCRCVA